MKYLYKKKSTEYKLAEVISIVSHQLKTPLAVIKGYLEVLISEDLGKINPKQKEYLKNALENTQRMIGLVKDLLDVSQIEENKLEFKTRPSSLEEIIKETAKEFSYLSRAKNCTLSFKVLGEIPLLDIDPLKIKQVVTNIISNAIEYNKRRGSVEITLKRKGNNVLFSCKDTGVGVPRSDRKKVFTKFYRSETAIGLTPSGLGLGLFISKAIIEKSGGRIWFESEEGKGSTFCFTLPLRKPF